MEPWRTALVQSSDGSIRIRGYDISALMQGSFADTVFLLHARRLPRPEERRLLDAMLVAVADHGSGAPSCAAARLAASGNRQSFSAAIAAGILAIGEEHGGAGAQCIEMIAAGVDEARRDTITIDEAARRVVRRRRQSRSRVPGLGDRVHTTDPRVTVLFEMARETKLAGDGVAFALALEAATRATIKPLTINVDGALAALLYDLGFPAAAGHLIFIIGRVAGLTAEVAEEYARERPMRIRIPVQYDGEPARELDGSPSAELQD